MLPASQLLGEPEVLPRYPRIMNVLVRTKTKPVNKLAKKNKV